MKKLIFVMLAIFIANSETIWHSDGSYTTINGDTAWHSDGSYSTRSGDTIYHSDGSYSTRSGDTTWNSYGDCRRPVLHIPFEKNERKQLVIK